MKYLKTFESNSNYTKLERIIIQKVRQLGLDSDDLDIFAHDKQSAYDHLKFSRWKLANRNRLKIINSFQGEVYDTKKHIFYADIEIKAYGAVEIAEVLITMVLTSMVPRSTTLDTYDMGLYVVSAVDVAALLDGSPTSLVKEWAHLSDEEKETARQNASFFDI